MPFLSIATEMWRGLRDCGEAFQEVAAATGNDAMAATAKAWLASAPLLLADIQASVKKDAFADKNGTHFATQCGHLSSYMQHSVATFLRTLSFYFVSFSGPCVLPHTHRKVMRMVFKLISLLCVMVCWQAPRATRTSPVWQSAAC